MHPDVDFSVIAGKERMDNKLSLALNISSSRADSLDPKKLIYTIYLSESQGKLEAIPADFG